MRKHDFNYIDAGYDVIRCKSQKELANRLIQYGSAYNELIKKEHVKLGTYKCAI